ncbi:MAG: amidohydrolase [Phenylobacterium sp.]|nr:amidohydrolase [Phenylobacterium sp.]
MRACLSMLALLLLSPAAAEAGDLYLVNGKVFVGAGRPPAQALAIRDGKIAAVGDDTAIRAMAGGQGLIDLGGRLVTPGLIEAHSHVASATSARQATMPNLPWPGPTPDEALAAVAAAARQGPGWVDGVIGPQVANDARDWRAALDVAAPDNPVALRAWWGHNTLVNSAALKALGVSGAAPDPMGGWLDRRADGSPNGRLRENAEWRLMRARDAGRPADAFAQKYRAADTLYASWGVTGVHVMLNNQGLPQALAALEIARPNIKWRLYGWAMPEQRMADAWDQFDGPPLKAGKVRIAGVKWVLDSTPIERDAHMSAPYADRPGWSGRSNYTDSQLRELLAGVLAHPRQQAALHVVGDAELVRLMDTMEAMAPAATWAERRVRIEHGDGLPAARFEQARRLGLVMVQNPLHLDPMPDAQGAPLIVARLGERAAANMPLKSLLAAGVPLALGSDAGGPPANPFLNMMLAGIAPTAPGEALSREQALAAYSAGGAFAEGEEREKGALGPGMAADLAVLSQDILTVPLEELPATRSLLTLVDGQAVHAEGPFAALKAP